MLSSRESFIKKLANLQNQAQREIQSVYHDALSIQPWAIDMGYGLTGVCEGSLLEKAAVSISKIKGLSLPPSATEIRGDLAGYPYEVTGLSIIFHPFSPLIPASHANIRKFSVYKSSEEVVHWFGGGVDLTPFFPIEEDCQNWHRSLKDYVQSFEPELYDLWRAQCDDYFFLKHRNEPRGIGGVFFDDYKGHSSSEETENFLVGLITWFLDQNFALAQKYRDIPIQQVQKDFQLWRRGRYAEFNLLLDRGTLFGLQSGGRVESILLSLPPHVTWIYRGDEIFKENNDLLLKFLRGIRLESKILKKF